MTEPCSWDGLVSPKPALGTGAEGPRCRLLEVWHSRSGRLAEGSATLAQTLTSSETGRLSQGRWRPVAPGGLLGRWCGGCVGGSRNEWRRQPK